MISQAKQNLSFPHTKKYKNNSYDFILERQGTNTNMVSKDY